MSLKKLKYFNGISQGYKYKDHYVYVCAYSLKQAAQLASQACYGKEVTDMISVTRIKQYFSPCWGNNMKDIHPVEPCVYLENDKAPNSKPFQVI